jgi:thiosulfate dehydrogenase
VKRWLAIFVLALAACAGGNSSETAAVSTSPAQLYDPKALPSGPPGEAIAYGHDIVVNTRKLMPGYVVTNMDCAACHVDAGLRPRAGSLVGAYARFPQWNKRSHRVITLQDRLAECFLYSMNGRPPAYSSKEMIALVAYIAWISRDTLVGTPQKPADRFIEPLPSGEPNIARGALLYAQKCESCHQINGAGAGAIPPLWGPTSFNAGAGMAHIDRMTGFVRYNMPQNAPGSLSLQDAYDVSAYVLQNGRPKFERAKAVSWPSQPASYF